MISKSRNIVTNPASNIEVGLFKHVEHMKDPFDHGKQIEKVLFGKYSNALVLPRKSNMRNPLDLQHMALGI